MARWRINPGKPDEAVVEAEDVEMGPWFRLLDGEGNVVFEMHAAQVTLWYREDDEGFG